MKKRLIAFLLCVITVITLLPVRAFAATKTPLKITKQPTSSSADIGKTVKTEVVAHGDGLTYQWYVKNPGQKKFTKSSVKEADYFFTMVAEKSGRQVYCIVKDRYGKSIKTQTVTLSARTALKITKQPADCRVNIGKLAQTTVAAQGDGLSYQWYLLSPGETEFVKSSVTVPHYAYTMIAEKSGRKVYCVVTDKYGKSVTTNTVTLRIPTALEITAQPQDSKVVVGQRVTTATAANGDGLSYQWYVKNPGDTAFSKSSLKTAEYSYVMTEAKSGRQVYCVITDQYGKKVTTDTATLSSFPVPKITKQPKFVAAQAGEVAGTAVVAEGVDLQYLWYVQEPGATGFVETDNTTSVYAYEMTEETSGRQVYCMITDRYGVRVKSNTVTIKIPTELRIVTQPKFVGVAEGTLAATKVVAEGDGLRYQWFVKDPGAKAFTKSSLTTATYSFKMIAAKSGRQVYCVITDHYGNSVTTDTVVMKIAAPLKITKQPSDVYAQIGKMARTAISATGDGIVYQWYLKQPADSEFSKSSVTVDNYAYVMVKEKAGRQVYCVITDVYGNKVTSRTVTFGMAKAQFDRSLYKVKPGKTRTVDLEITENGIDDEIIWTSSNTSIAKVNTKGVITGVKNGTVTITARGKNTGFVATCKVKVCNVKQVAITFDDGPAKRTGELLDFLKENDIRVTFFLVGNRISSYKNTVKRQVAEGHEIGYHSWDHTNQKKLSDAQIISDYNKATKTLKNLTGAEFTVWRAPGGNRNDRVLNCIDLPHIMWSVDTLDWKYRDSSRTCKVIKNNAKDGAIILLHDLHSTTVTGAMKALKEMQDGDYEFLTVTELLSRNGKAPKPNTTYSHG